MTKELLVDISRALEEKFYRQQDLAILDFLRTQADDEKLRAQLRTVSQIEDVAVLDGLMRVGVTAESFTAFSLLPLVRVAWVDGVEDSERAAVLSAAAGEGIAEDSANYQLLQGWLQERPEPKLLDAWRNYVAQLARELDESSLRKLRDSTLDRARRVAQVAGGILGVGNRISKSEELTLIDLAHSFDKPRELL